MGRARDLREMVMARLFETSHHLPTSAHLARMCRAESTRQALAPRFELVHQSARLVRPSGSSPELRFAVVGPVRLRIERIRSYPTGAG